MGTGTSKARVIYLDRYICIYIYLYSFFHLFRSQYPHDSSSKIFSKSRTYSHMVFPKPPSTQS